MVFIVFKFPNLKSVARIYYLVAHFVLLQGFGYSSIYINNEKQDPERTGESASRFSFQVWIIHGLLSKKGDRN